jgi:hypothetical protein
MIDFNCLVTARLNLYYDQELFCQEYDQRILPKSTVVANGHRLIQITEETNKQWNMVDPDIYVKADARTREGKMIVGGYSSWQGASLMYLDTDNIELKEASKMGSVSVRNYALDTIGEFKFFPEFEDLHITKFIKNLPLTTLIGIRCVSLQPGTFALIHSDNSNQLPVNDRKAVTQKMVHNFLWKQGFVQFTINISDGGVPLFYNTTSELTGKHLTINDPIYLFNDFVKHGVPLTTSRRRQIRITGRPTAELADYIEKSTAINLGD